MRILFDHCTPWSFRRFLPGHEIQATYKCGWSRVSNVKLLAAAAGAGFQVLLTVDQGIAYQQNIAKLPVSIIAIESVSFDIDVLAGFVPLVVEALRRVEVASAENRKVLLRVTVDGIKEG